MKSNDQLITKLEQRNDLSHLGAVNFIEDYDMQVPVPRNAAADVVPGFAISLADAKDRILLLQEFVKDMMVQGIDYGVVPGCPKPCLLKPGAEKLCDIFGFSKRIEVLNRQEDWNKGLFAYEVKTTLINKRTSLVEAEGVGNCNSQEKKYKTQDAFSIANTVLKMAKKRALVDAVLSATRSSGLFTQDLEDMGDMPVIMSSTPEPENRLRPRPITDKQQKKIYYLINELKMPLETIKTLLMDRYGVETWTQLTVKEGSDFIEYLMQFKS
jgi:hypothetical protein